MQRLFRASSYRGLHLPGKRGTVVDPFGPKAIFCGNDIALDILGGSVIHISLTPSQLQSSSLDEQVQNTIANDFQPRLLMYRLKNSGELRESARCLGIYVCNGRDRPHSSGMLPGRFGTGTRYG